MWHVRSILCWVVAVSLVGCGKRGSDARGGYGDGSGGSETRSFTPSKERFSRVNYRKVLEKWQNGIGTPVTEVEKLFGSATKIEHLRDGKLNYTWTGETKDQWFSGVVNGKFVEIIDWPGKAADDARRGTFAGNAEPLAVHLRNHALSHHSKLPSKVDELTELKAKLPKAYELIQNGEIVVPWGKSANILMWAWWKDTPETGGPYLRFDGKRVDCTAAQFVKLRETPITSSTIPTDLVNPKEPRPPAGDENGPPPGFWFWMDMSGMIAPMLQYNPPASFDAFPKFMARSNGHKWVLHALEKKEVVISWGRPLDEGIWAYPVEFPKRGGWAIVKGERRVYTADEAAKLLADHNRGSKPAK